VSLQRIVLVPTDAAHPTFSRPRRGVVLAAPDPAAQALAATTGLPTITSPELAAAGPAEAEADRVRRLETLVRGHAVSDRFRDVVVVTDGETVRAVATELCALPGASTLPGGGEVVTVGLPRAGRPVRLGPALVGAGLVSLLTLVTLDRLYPLVIPAVVALGGLVLLPWPGTRHVGRTLLAQAGLAAVVVFVVVAGSGRFPAE
jgi:hypothetical protein